MQVQYSNNGKFIVCLAAGITKEDAEAMVIAAVAGGGISVAFEIVVKLLTKEKAREQRRYGYEN